MAKKIIFAVAGAGKTFTICKILDTNKRNLILTYTNENVSNIVKELNKHGKYDAANVKVMTFDSFKYRYILKPYEPLILDSFSCSQLCNGIIFERPPQQFENGKYNRYYISQNKIGHYRSKYGYYCSRISKLINYVDYQNKFLKLAIKNIGRFVDHIYIDEFQDFVGNDFDIIMKIYKEIDSCLLVGDYYQHSVKSSEQKQYNNRRKTIYETYPTKESFIKHMKKEYSVMIDDSSLSNSRRCCDAVCRFVDKKLNICIRSQKINNGKVTFVIEGDVESILSDDNIVKLKYNNSSKYSFNSKNWAYSKGGTFSSTCVILTNEFEKIDDENFNINAINCGLSTINSLYVALTRSSGDVYILKYSLFRKYEKKYLKC